MTVDAGELWNAAERGPAAARSIRGRWRRNVPAHLRDPGDRWFGLSMRARTIAYSPQRVDPAQLEHL